MISCNELCNTIYSMVKLSKFNSRWGILISRFRPNYLYLDVKYRVQSTAELHAYVESNTDKESVINIRMVIGGDSASDLIIIFIERLQDTIGKIIKHNNAAIS